MSAPEDRPPRDDDALDAMRVPSLSRFLARAKASLREPGRKTFVVGNESVDLDTLTTSLLLAYLRTHPLSPHRASATRISIPLVPLPRADLPLRPEFLPVLAAAGASPADLVTLDDLPSPSTSASDDAPEPPELFLVDHNAPTGPVKDLHGTIIGVVDHHVDEGVVSADVGTRVIRTAGSCGSLGMEWAVKSGRWEEEWVAGLDGEEARRVAGIGKMALASVLVDTGGLRARDKVTGVDEWAAGVLEGVVRSGGGGYEREEWYQQVVGVKRELRGLGVEEMLRKDYKEWTEAGGRVGFASVVKSVGEIAERAETRDGETAGEAVVRITEGFAVRKGLDTLVVMTAYSGVDGFRREIALVPGTERGREVVDEFARRAGEEMRLGAWMGVEGVEAELRRLGGRVWVQGNTAWSRKQVAPFVRGLLKGEASL